MSPHARRTDPTTSHAAAKTVSELNKKQLAVWQLFFAYGAMSDEELADRYGHSEMNLAQSPSGLRTRRRELVDAGLLRDSHVRILTKANRQTIVWEIDPNGVLE